LATAGVAELLQDIAILPVGAVAGKSGIMARARRLPTVRTSDIAGLETGGDCQEGYLVQLSETGWKEVVIRLLGQSNIHIES
jgi:hypothetical protein